MPDFHNENAPASGRGVKVQKFGDELHLHDTTAHLFDGHVVRVVLIDGLPWFVAADVCAALGVKNPTQAIAALDDDERSMLNIGRQGEANIVSESGLYTLTLRSRGATKPGSTAHRFRRWVTGDVLPTVRRTGQYGAPAIPENFAAALRLAADQAERIEAQAAQIEHQRPAVTFVEGYVAASGTASIREAGKVLNVPQNRFIGWLEDEGILFRQSGRLMPNATYQKRGFFTVKTGQAHDRSFSQVRVTPVGIEWLARRWAKRDDAEGVSP